VADSQEEVVLQLLCLPWANNLEGLFGTTKAKEKGRQNEWQAFVSVAMNLLVRYKQNI
jgi:hypothetical protein